MPCWAVTVYAPSWDHNGPPTRISVAKSPLDSGDTWSTLTRLPFGDVTVNVTSWLVLLVWPVISIVSDPSIALAEIDNPPTSSVDAVITSIASELVKFSTMLDCVADVSAVIPPFTSTLTVML